MALTGPDEVHNDIEDIYPLSPLQQGMLFHTLLQEGSGVYLMQDRYRLGGRIDEAAFLEAWRLVVAAHPSLRASFQWKTQKQPVQVIHHAVDLPLQTLDLRGLDAEEQERRIRALLEDEQREGFNLAKPPLIRFRLLRLGDESWEFIRSFHHILMDAWCISLVMVEFLNAYEALRHGEKPQPRTPRPYRDYIVWLQKQDGSAAERFWREQLAGLSSPTPLVVDQGAKHNRYTSVVHVDDRLIELGEADTQSLLAFCRMRRITPNTFFQGAWSLLLARYSGQRDVLFGVTVAGRPPELAGVEEMIGLFINTLPLRARVDPDAPLSQWLAQLQALNLQMRDFEHTPLTDIQGWSDFPRGETLFDSILVYENAPIDEKILAGDFSFRLEGMDHSVHTHYGLTVVILPGARLGIRISYDRERFDAATVQRMLGHLRALVRGMLTAPDAPLASFELLADDERRQLLLEWAHNPHPFPLQRSYAALFAEQAARRPQQAAAVCQGEALSYAELDRRSTRLAHALRAAGAGPEALVALAAPRGLELLTMMVAVFKAGAAMLPLEVNHPPERLREVLRLSRAPVLLASEGCRPLLDALLTGLEPAPRALLSEAGWREGDDRALPPLGAPEALAYVLFTSGSTGTPKGVMIEQRGMLNNIFGKLPALGLSQQDRIAQTASVAFDISVWQFLAAPALGATVHILPDEVAHDPQRLAQAVADERLTVLELVPSLMRSLLAVCPRELDLPSLRWVLPTGEALPPTVARAWLERFPHIPLMNAYGPAECADDVAFQPIRSPADVCGSHMPIGRPTANNELFVLDEALRPVPIGVPGEICVGGVGVGRGYLHDEERTRQAFVRRPAALGAAAQARLYRTGDIGRWRADGSLEYLGRADQQVKLRGHRIELAEIEHRLCQHPAVEAAAVVLREDAQGEAHLVGYWQATEDAPAVDSAALGAHLSAQLPAYMVPSLLAPLPALPLNANGKVDRKALAARPLDWQAERRAAIAPRNDAERAVAEIWCAVLGREGCGVEGNFFALGGHSLLATQVVARVRARFKVDLPLRALFEQPTVAGLAQAVTARVAANGAANGASAPPAPIARPRPAALPLSFAQQRLWFIEQLTPGTTLFNIPFALRLCGELDVAALRASLDALLARHEILRTSIAGEGDALCQRIAEGLEIALPLLDLSGLALEAADAAQAAALNELFDAPFDLRTAPLLRARLLRRSPTEHVLAVTLHHMVSDAWSATIALRELALGYAAFHAGRAPALPPLPIQYADFALWQREHLQGAELERQLAHWKRVLARPDGSEPVLPLPTDHPRPPVQSYRAGLVRATLAPETSERLHAFAARSGLTPFAVVLAGFAGLLERLSGERTVLIGTPVTQRERPGTEGLLGMLVNNLVVRADFDGAPGFAQLARRVGERLEEARRHQDLPFEQLVDALQLPRSLSHAPLYQVMVAQQLPMESRLCFPGLEIEALDTPLRHSECDLDLHVICPGGAPVELELMHALDLFRADTAARLLERFAQLLGAMLAEPERPLATLPLLTPAEWQQTVVDWNRTHSPAPLELGFHQLFAQQAARTPARTAVVCEGRSLSYDALNRRANQLAHHLRACGVGPNVPVALCAERSLELFVGLLGILKAGGAYVPLDPAYPAERLAYMLEDARPALLLAQQGLMPALAGLPRFELDGDWALAARQPEHDPQQPTLPEQLAYVMYTSGSTGKPKGTLVRHRSVVNLAWARIGLYRRYTTDALRASFNYSYAFDSSVAELALLLDGHTLHVVPEAARYAPEALVAFFREHRLDAFECTPAQLKPVIEAGDTAHLPRFVLFGGDAIDASLWQRLQHIPGVRFFNTYGPTECTVDATGCELRESPERPVIGRPIANVRTYVLDAHLNPLPIGMPGELHIGGEGVAAGYLDRPELSAQKFLPDPFAGEARARMYKTGDLVRWLPDGQLEYLGRIDHQVKIRGFRVELGEIEALLGRQPGVRQAVVLAREDRPGDKRLVAYLAADGPADAGALRAAVAAELPDYMLPARFVFLDALPLTGNGKIDRRALPAPDWTEAPAADAPPQGQAERLLAALWSEVLDVPLPHIGRHSQFFHLGGHSLLAAALFARLRQRFEHVPPLRAIFEQPTLAGLAAGLGAPRADAAPGWLPRPRPARLPLSAAQRRLWFLQRLADGGEYNVTTALALDGAPDLQRLRDALQAVVNRQEILRSRVVESDQGPELRIEPHAPLALQIETAPEDEAAWTQRRQAAVRAETARPFDLALDMPLRARLLRRAGRDEHLLLLTLHHSVTDDASTQVLLDEIAAAYRGDTLPALVMQYADYALWQEDDAQQVCHHEQLQYWTRTLGDGDYVLDLPTDRPRPARLDPAAGAVHATLPPALAQRLRAYAQARGATLYMVLLAAAQLLLGRYANQREVRVATPVANRPLPELQPLIGCFVNTLVLRADLDPALDFDALLAQVKDGLLDAQAHQDVPFEQVVDALAPQRQLGQTPLAQVLFVMQNAAPRAAAWPGLAVRELAVESPAAKFDLNWEVHDGERLSVMLEYRSALFERATAERWLAEWQALLQAIVAAPQRCLRELWPLSAADRHRQVVEWNATDKAYPGPMTLSQALALQARSSPDATALVFEGEALSYAALHARADRVAQALRAAGVGREQVVAVCMERSVELVVALLGVVKAGAAYLPLDPSLPPARLAFLLEDADARLTLAQPRLAPKLPPERAVWTLDALPPAPEAAAEPINEPADLVYLLYTSGSTGQPKGVLTEHGALMNRLHWMQEAFALGAEDRVLQKTPYGFDVSVWEFFWPLVTGATLVLARPEGHRDPAYLAALVRSERVTTLHFVPSMLRAFVDEPALADCRALRQVFASGEALPPDLVQRFMARHPAALVNLYGPTEAAIDVSMWRCTPQASVVPIGRPIANLRLYILDETLEPLPIGAIGELYIGGAGVARGYLKRPELNAERFLPSPFVPGERLYRTGDRCRFRPDGEIEYLGRLDHQVKLRGQRIELGEIDAALRAQPGVRDAATLLQDEQLVAFWCGEADEPRLRAALADTLPAHMLPSLLVPLDALPLNANGKLDRKALSALPLPQAGGRYVAPRTPVEATLCALFAELLGQSQVGIHDGFFALGGHSLLATRLVARVREALSLTLPLASVFAHPTVAALAEQLQQARLDAIPRLPRPARLPLGLAQHRFWMLSRLAPDSTEYHMPFALAIRGPLDVAALREALAMLAQRHLVLRSRIVERDGEAELVVDEQAPALAVRTLAAPDWDAACAQARREIAAPFELAAAPPWRTQLLVCEERSESLLLLCLHHSAADGWAMQLLVDELGQAYRAAHAGTVPQWAPLPIDYVDFALWQQHPEHLGRREASLDHWRRTLGDGDYRLGLPTDRPQGAEPARDAGRVEARFGREGAEGVRRFARERGITPYVVLAAGLAALLARYSGERDIRIGTPVDRRERPETQTLLACLVNTLVLRTDVDMEAPAETLLAKVETRLRVAQAHADLPFEILVGALCPHRELGRSPLFQVMFSLQHGRLPAQDWPGLALREEPLPAGHAKFEQNWEVHDDGEDLVLALEYQAALFDAATMSRWAEQWIGLVAALVADPRRPLAELFPLERDAALISAWNATERAYGGPDTLPQALLAQLERTPHAPALHWQGEVLSYRELHRRAARLAHALQAQGVGPERIVPVCMVRAPELVVALLAVTLAGAAYLPIDPELPPARIALLVEESGSPLVLTQRNGQVRLPAAVQAWCLDERDFADRPDRAPPVSVRPEQLAYVIYTSGSTGVPKGVLTEHGALMNRLHWMQDAFPIGPGDRVLQKTPYGFDVSVWEFFWPLVSGATLVLAKPEGHRDPAYLVELIRRERVSTLHFVPSMLRAFVDEPGLAGCTSLRQVFASGEALPPDLVARFMARHPAALVNLYGPTEAAIDVSMWRCMPDATLVPIGRPIANTRLHVLDERGRALPIGAAGELHIGGVQLARGYLRRPELTAERFVERNGERLYRTGDRCRWLPDGTVEYLGRLDHQVKLRGLRIELQEIDATLLRQAKVTDAATLAIGERLVVFWCGDAEESALQAALAAELPAYMVPALWVRLDALPLNANGKLDRKALAALPLPQAASAPVPAGNALEALICRLFGELLGPALLGNREIGAQDGFFALGGDSILGLKLIARLREHGYSITPRDLFRSPTAAALAQVAAPLQAAGEQGELLGDVELLPIQHGFLNQDQPHPAHWNQSVLADSERRLDAARVEASLAVLLGHHDALRLRFVRRGDGPWRAHYAPVAGSLRFLRTEDPDALQELAAGLDLAHGPLFAAALLEGSPQRLYLLAHHLVVDAVSWQILLEDFQRVYEALERGEPPSLPAKTASCRQWAAGLAELARTPAVQAQQAHWEAQQPDAVAAAPLPALAKCRALHAAWTVERTRQWLTESHAAYRTRPEELLIAALAATLAEADGRTQWVVDLERHGRGAPLDGLDVSRTVGWFTVLHPVRLESRGDPGARVRSAKEALRAVPGEGLGCGLLRRHGRLASVPGDVLFNYLGQEASSDGWLHASSLSAPPDIDPRNRVTHAREVIGWLQDGALQLEWRTVHGEADARLPERLLAHLDALVEHCIDPNAGALMPSDFPLAKGMNQKTLDKLLKRLA